MNGQIRIELTAKERRDRPGVIAFVFATVGNTLSIREEWESFDEIYSDGASVRPPLRIVKLALEWLQEEQVL